MASKIIIENVKYIIADKNIPINAGDNYYSVFHKKILSCYNENHSKGLNLLNENRFNTLTENDFNYKVIDNNKI